ncbi:hypothetical protein BC827DRAFT_356558 [Russula dissimulans]|nr:hypothetical protein BC827DRAFT_356558 [Russula dissimulans]
MKRRLSCVIYFLVVLNMAANVYLDLQFQNSSYRGLLAQCVRYSRSTNDSRLHDTQSECQPPTAPRWNSALIEWRVTSTRTHWRPSKILLTAQCKVISQKHYFPYAFHYHYQI